MLIVTKFLLIAVFLENFTKQVYSQDSTALTSNNYKQSLLLKYGFSGIFWNYLNTNSSFVDYVSPKCSQSLIHLIQDINSDSASALQFISSSGRLPQNFLTTGYADFGDYDKCLEVSWSKQEVKALGQYCLTSLLPKNVYIDDKITVKLSQPYKHFIQVDQNFIFKIGFCIPTTCSKQDLSQLLAHVLEPISWEVIKVDSCETPKTWIQKFSQAHIVQQASLLTLILIVVIVILCSLLELCNLNGKVLPKWFSKFTVQRSFRSLIHVNQESRCVEIDRFRIISDVGTIMFHSLLWAWALKSLYLLNPVSEILSNINLFYVQPFTNDWLSEVLFFLGGLSKTLELWRKSSSKPSITFYFSQILRRFILFLYPLTIFIMLEIASPLLISGPLVASIGQEKSQLCINTYWYSLLQIQTSLHFPNFCSISTWIIAAECHLYILVCFLVYCYRKSVKLGLTLNIISVLIGYALIFQIFYSRKLRPFVVFSPIDFEAAMEYYTYYYIQSYSHIWSYSICVLITYFIMAKHHELISKNQLAQLFGILSVLLLIFNFTPSIWNTFHLETGQFFIALYSVILRLVIGTFFFLLFLFRAEGFYQYFSSDIEKKIENIMMKKPETNEMDNNINGDNTSENNISRDNNNKDGDKLNEVTKRLTSSTHNQVSSYFQNGNIYILLRKITSYASSAHIPMLIFYILSFKKPLSSTEYLISGLTFIASTFIGGFVMLFFFLGPYNNLMRR